MLLCRDSPHSPSMKARHQLGLISTGPSTDGLENAEVARSHESQMHTKMLKTTVSRGLSLCLEDGTQVGTDKPVLDITICCWENEFGLQANGVCVFAAHTHFMFHAQSLRNRAVVDLCVCIKLTGPGTTHCDLRPWRILFMIASLTRSLINR